MGQLKNKRQLTNLHLEYVETTGGQTAEVDKIVKLKTVVHVSVPVEIYTFCQVNVYEL